MWVGEGASSRKFLETSGGKRSQDGLKIGRPEVMGKCGKRPSHYPITHSQEHQGQPWQLWTLWAHPFRPLPEKSWRHHRPGANSSRRARHSQHPGPPLLHSCTILQFTELPPRISHPTPGATLRGGYLYRPHFKDEETKSDA